MLRKELQGLEKQIELCLTSAYMKGYNEGRNEAGIYELTHRTGKDINAPTKAEEIRIGDEMCSVDDRSLKIVVINVDTFNDRLTGFGLRGTYSDRPMKYWRKTGRHCSKIEEIAEWLNNEIEVDG